MTDDRRWFPLGGRKADRDHDLATLRGWITNPRGAIRPLTTSRLPGLPRPVLRAPEPGQQICPTCQEFTCECDDLLSLGEFGESVARGVDKAFMDSVFGSADGLTTTNTVAPEAQEPFSLGRLNAMFDEVNRNLPRFVAWSMMPTDKATVLRTSKHYFVVAHPDFWTKVHIKFIEQGEKMPPIEDADEDAALRKKVREAWSETLRQFPLIYPAPEVYRTEGMT